MFDFRYTDFTSEASVVTSDPTPLATAALGDAAMVDVNVERPVWVYKITHICSGRSYIGITTRRSVRRRWYEHANAVARGKTTKIAFAIRKYGADAFSFEVVYEAVNLREACAVERGLIAQYGTLGRKNGFNLTSGGDEIPGAIHLAETKAKLSRIVQKQWKVDGYREKIVAALNQRVLPESHIEHLREQAAAMKGKKRKPESIEKGRISQMGHPGYFAGRKHTLESIEKIRVAASEKWRDEKIAKARSRARTPEQKERIRAGLREFYKDPEKRLARADKVSASKEASGYSHSEAMKQKYRSDPTLRVVRGEQFRALWDDPEIRARMLKGRSRLKTESPD